jgi:hypothetical protein
MATTIGQNQQPRNEFRPATNNDISARPLAGVEGHNLGLDLTLDVVEELLHLVQIHLTYVGKRRHQVRFTLAPRADDNDRSGAIWLNRLDGLQEIDRGIGNRQKVLGGTIQGARTPSVVESSNHQRDSRPCQTRRTTTAPSLTVYLTT